MGMLAGTAEDICAGICMDFCAELFMETSTNQRIDICMCGEGRADIFEGTCSGMCIVMREGVCIGMHIECREI